MDPARSACVLIGVSRYEHLPDLHSVGGNLTALQRLLTDGSVWGVPKDRLWTVPDPRTPGDLTARIYDAAAKAPDTLIVYYAGHGLRSIEDDQLYLTVSTSQANRPETTVPYRRLKQILESCRDRVKRRVVVLDCCHSGQALDGMAVSAEGLHDAEIRTKGSYVLTSTAKEEKALADSMKAYTAFSGELIKILDSGDPSRSGHERLCLDDIHELLVDALDRRSLPHPRKQDQDGVGRLAFIRNRACARPSAALPPYWTPRRRLAAGLVLAASLVAGVAAGGWWAPWSRSAPEDDRPPAAFPGSCGKGSRGTLLDVSDRLDRPPKNLFRGSEVAGLSALSFADGNGHAFAIRDDMPPQIFSLTLGGSGKLPGTLKPNVTNVKSVHEEDGSKRTEFDGEGLAVERGGKTALVSAEKGPSLLRVRLRDGRQLGKELRLPETFHPPERGLAQATRNVESLALTPDGKHLFAGMEGPLLGDEDVHGRHQVRIQRYEGDPGGDYEPESQFAYQTEDGLFLSELAAVGPDHLLALERGYIIGLGNSVRVYEVDLRDAANVSKTERLVREDSDLLADKQLLFDLSACPPGDVETRDTQQNPLLDNVEGMALAPGKLPASAGGDTSSAGTGGGGEADRDRRALYLVSDNNERHRQTTRLYSLAVSLRRF
jgi:hypothetical protein